VHRSFHLTWLFFACLLLTAGNSTGQDTIEKPKVTAEVSGSFKGDYRYFPHDALYPGQHQEYFSAVFQPEIYTEWNDGKQLLQFAGFARIDQYDTKRTHADIRELYWQAIFKKWEISVGLKKIFWGVTESNHVVDIINQLDVLEGFDVEQKLGQPMVHLSLSPKKMGTFDFYAMPYFRPMQFAGPEGRLRPPFDLDNVVTSYEAEMEEYNPDLAIRWSHNFSVFDIGLSHFYGTSRLPLFQITQDSNGVNLNQQYELINQTGLDLLTTTGPILWKAEIIHRESKRKTITALVAGFEYTFSNMFRSGVDLGLIVEYNYDDRGLESINALNDDYFFGARLAFNDRQSTDLIGGVIIDSENKTLRYFGKVNRRLGSSWKLSFEVAGFDNVADTEFLYLIRNDSFGQISLAKYF